MTGRRWFVWEPCRKWVARFNPWRLPPWMRRRRQQPINAQPLPFSVKVCIK